MDGNSLGRMPREASFAIQDASKNAWGERLIRSWNEGWYTMSSQIGDRIAPIAGASPGEIIVTDSTSVNLYKLAYAALKKNTGRKKIITDDLNFPSDIYILQGLIEEFGHDYELVILESSDGMIMDIDKLEQAIDMNTALVCLSHVVFKSAFKYPMKRVTELVQAKGALMLWDLSHSIGSVPGELNEANVDLAVACTYKYLNGGPGAPAFLYVRKDLQEDFQSPIWGWFGQHEPFKFSLQYKPASGIHRFLAGTPPILSITPLSSSLDIFAEAGMEQIRNKSVKQSEYLIDLVNQLLLSQGIRIGSPLDHEIRGSHITLRHKEAYRICKALIDPSVGDYVVIPDFREPDNIRLGISPLYNSYIDIYNTVIQISEIISQGIFEKYSSEREEVT
jgi:kynureninase